MFIDEVTIIVKSGAGARGCASFHYRTDHKRIPNGGDGGAGGDIIIRADTHTGSLWPLKSKRIFEAERGGHGTRNKQAGRKGKDFIVKVPPGTTIHNKKDQLLIRDLVHADDEVVVVKGGRGGYGNHSGKPATLGEEAKELELHLSYKIIADIFLLGLPNSGKTTLLKKLTGAGVEEAEYPFATKAPQCGTYQSNYSALSLCELPAVYEASEQGRGLGTNFLKHLERAKLIFFVLDPKSEFSKDVKDGFQILFQIVERFNEDFLKIPRLVVVNKADLLIKAERKKKIIPKEKVYYVSSKTGEGIEELMNDAQEILGRSHETAV